MATSDVWQKSFSQGVSAILQNWEALRMAVDQQFGGPHSREKGAWLEEVTAQWFFDNKGIEPEELEDYLASLMDQEFDTIVEDGSLKRVSADISRLYSQCSSGDLERAQELADLCSKLEVSTTKQQQEETPSATIDPSSEEKPEDDGDGSGEEDGDDGWEVVSRKRR